MQIFSRFQINWMYLTFCTIYFISGFFFVESSGTVTHHGYKLDELTEK